MEMAYESEDDMETVRIMWHRYVVKAKALPLAREQEQIEEQVQIDETKHERKENGPLETEKQCETEQEIQHKIRSRNGKQYKVQTQRHLEMQADVEMGKKLQRQSGKRLQKESCSVMERCWKEEMEHKEHRQCEKDGGKKYLSKAMNPQGYGQVREIAKNFRIKTQSISPVVVKKPSNLSELDNEIDPGKAPSEAFETIEEDIEAQEMDMEQIEQQKRIKKQRRRKENRRLEKERQQKMELHREKEKRRLEEERQKTERHREKEIPREEERKCELGSESKKVKPKNLDRQIAKENRLQQKRLLAEVHYWKEVAGKLSQDEKEDAHKHIFEGPDGQSSVPRLANDLHSENIAFIAQAPKKYNKSSTFDVEGISFHDKEDYRTYTCSRKLIKPKTTTSPKYVEEQNEEQFPVSTRHTSGTQILRQTKSEKSSVFPVSCAEESDLLKDEADHLILEARDDGRSSANAGQTKLRNFVYRGSSGLCSEPVETVLPRNNATTYPPNQDLFPSEDGGKTAEPLTMDTMAISSLYDDECEKTNKGCCAAFTDWFVALFCC